MSTKSLIHQAKLNEWATRFADLKASGLPVKEWCLHNNISKDKYFYGSVLSKTKPFSVTYQYQFSLFLS